MAFVVVLGFALVALATAAPAMAKANSCADQVVNDWYDNQRVDKLYPQHCYREAIAGLPLDLEEYSNAKEAILRALAYAASGQLVPGANGRSAKGSLVKPIAWRNTADAYAVIRPDGSDLAAGPTKTSGPSSVPIPLIVLAGLAGLLLIAGGAGYVARRVQARRGGPPPTP